jgi:hypothetical protein
MRRGSRVAALPSRELRGPWSMPQCTKRHPLGVAKAPAPDHAEKEWNTAQGSRVRGSTRRGQDVWSFPFVPARSASLYGWRKTGSRMQVASSSGSVWRYEQSVGWHGGLRSGTSSGRSSVHAWRSISPATEKGTDALLTSPAERVENSAHDRTEQLAGRALAEASRASWPLYFPGL